MTPSNDTPAAPDGSQDAIAELARESAGLRARVAELEDAIRTHKGSYAQALRCGSPADLELWEALAGKEDAGE